MEEDEAPILRSRVVGEGEDDDDAGVEDDGDAGVDFASAPPNWLCCDPRRWLHRWLILAFCMCFLNFGSYFCYDNPAALEDKFTSAAGMGLSETNYALLYTVYAWPNVVFPLIGGLLIDGFLGLRVGGIVFAGFIMLGQVVFAAGALGNALWLMLLGRVLFAVGGENLAVVQNNYAVKWFKGKELNTVFGIQLSFARLVPRAHERSGNDVIRFEGSTVNMYCMAPIFAWVHAVWSQKEPYTILGTTLMIGAASTIISFLVALALGFFDFRRDRILAAEKASAEVAEAEAPVSIWDIAQLPPSLWLLSLICVAYYNAVFPFIGFGLLFFESKFGLSPLAAASANSLIYLISIGASPLAGALVDYFGRNVVWVGVAAALSLGAHALLAFTFVTPFLGVVLLGLGYSLLAASLWSMVAYAVPERLLGTAYGAMQSIQNLGLGVIFIAAGAILDKGGYFMLELFFIFWLCLAIGATVILYIVDLRISGGVLSMNRQARTAYLEANPL